jgi:hypothetical protein
MLGTDIRGIIAEEEEVQRRKDALKSLLSMRSKQLRESLEQRIKRARICGDWIQLSQEECATLHKRKSSISSLSSTSFSTSRIEPEGS